MPDTILFYAFTALVLIAALRVVTARNLFHSALYLAAFLFGVAALYVLLNAYFIAAIQVLIYIGAVVVLTIFVISLTKNTEEKSDPRDWKARIRIAAGVIAGLLSFSLIAVIVIKSNPSAFATEPASNNSANTIGNLLMGNLVLPFELVSVLLLAALLAAIAIVAKDREERT
jgi:NADH-quinone oxidoreductase subunit J